MQRLDSMTTSLRCSGFKMTYVIATGEVDDVWFLADMYEEREADFSIKKTFYWAKKDFIIFGTEYEAREFIEKEKIKRARWVIPTGIYLL